MRSFALIAGLAALAVASPMPQSASDLLSDLPVPDIVSVPIGAADNDTIAYDPDAAADAAVAVVLSDASSDNSVVTKRSLVERGACDPQPAGYGPTSPEVADDPTSFKQYAGFSTAATTAVTPSGYVNTFTDKKASVNACGYLTYKTYTSYDVNQAALDCNAIVGCKGFNIFFERDPTLNPGTGCTNPASTTVIKASFWGNLLNPVVATNTGQYRSKFQVVIAGSNAYNVVDCPYASSGYAQRSLNHDGGYGNCAIQAPGTSCTAGQGDSYLRSATFQDGVLDHSRCQKVCDTITGPDACKFFTSYMLVTNGKCGVQQCGFYKRAWDNSYCTNTGQGQVTIQWSSGFTSTTDDGVATCPLTNQPAYFRR